MPRSLLIDVTRAHLHTEKDLIARAVAAYSDRVVTIVRYEDQPSVPEYPTEVILRDRSGYTAVVETIRRLVKKLTDDPGGAQPLAIVTFHPAVFALHREFEPYFGSNLEVVSFSRLPYRFHNAERFAWPQHVLEIDEAVEVLTAALRENDATSRDRAMPKSRIGQVLASFDPRFRRPNPLAIITGVTTAIVEEAVRRQLLRPDVTATPEDPRFWVATPTGQRPEASPVSSPSSADQREAHLGRSRSQSYIEVLRLKRLWVLPATRDKLFDNVDNVIAGGGRLAWSLLNEAVNRLRAENALPQNVPWRRLREFLIVVCGRTELLCDARGSAFLLTASDMTREVTTMAPRWRDEVERSLVLSLVESGVRVSSVDADAVAGALYLVRDDVSLGKVYGHFAELFKRGALISSADGSYSRVRP